MTTALAFVLLSVVAWGGVKQLTEIVNKFPEYKTNIEAKTRLVNGYVSQAWARISRTTGEIGEQLTKTESIDPSLPSGSRFDSPYPVRIVQPSSSPLLMAGRIFGSMLAVIGTASIVIVLVIFFLIRREDLRDRFIRLVSHGQFGITTQALDDAAERVRRYLTTQLAINTTYGTAVAISMFAIGVPAALLWGVLGTILRFIPYVGPWMAALMPISLSLAVADGWTQPLVTVVVFIVLELMTNLGLEPWLYGSRTGVSPVAVLLSAVFWTWLWGGIGLLLATPLTVCFAVVGKHVPQLGFLNILLGDEPVFEPKTRVYQRLLAGDTFAQDASIDPITDTGRVDENPLVICLPARDKADEISSNMLTQLLTSTGFDVESVSTSALANEKVDVALRRNATVICISAMPPAAVTHARYLCKRIVAKIPQARIIVGLWDTQSDLAKAKARLGCGDDILVVKTLKDAQLEVRRLAQSPAYRNSQNERHGEHVREGDNEDSITAIASMCPC